MAITRDISVDWGVTGLDGTLTYNVVDTLDADLIAASTSGVTEFPAGSGIYHKRLTDWEPTWVGRIIWRDGTAGVGHFASEAFDAMPATQEQANNIASTQTAMQGTLGTINNTTNDTKTTVDENLDTAVSTRATPADVASGGTGSGDTPIDHNGGPSVTVNGSASVTDIMQFTVGGVGVDDVEVVAYLKADYDAGLRATENRQGTTTTGSDGRWVAPLMLDAGTYTVLGNKDDYVVAVLTVVVP